MRALIPDTQYFEGESIQLKDGSKALDSYTDQSQEFKNPSPIPFDAAGRLPDVFRQGLYDVGTQQDCGTEFFAWGRYDDDSGYWFGEGIDAVEQLTSPARVRVYFTEEATGPLFQIGHAFTNNATGPTFATANPINSRTIDFYLFDENGTRLIVNELRFERYWW